MSPTNARAHIEALERRLLSVESDARAMRKANPTAAALTTLMFLSSEKAALEAAVECLRRECSQGAAI